MSHGGVPLIKMSTACGYYLALWCKEQQLGMNGAGGLVDKVLTQHVRDKG